MVGPDDSKEDDYAVPLAPTTSLMQIKPARVIKLYTCSGNDHPSSAFTGGPPLGPAPPYAWAHL